MNDKAKDTPLVSVIIPTHGRPQTLRRAITSVIKQSYSPIEIIVVDDNGNNSEYRIHTESLMNEYIEDEKVKYITYEKNMNASYARNIGIKESSGEYITFLDDDDEMLPTKIDLQVNRMEGLDKTWGACYTAFEVQKGGVIEKSLESREGQPLLDALARNFFICGGSNIMIRKEVIHSVGMFDESFQRNQDIEYLARIIEKYRIAYVDKISLIIHQENQSDRKQTYTYERSVEVDEFYLNAFSDKLEKLSYEEMRYVYKIIALNRFKVSLTTSNVFDGFVNLKRNRVGICETVHYLHYLINRRLTHTIYSYKAL